MGLDKKFEELVLDLHKQNKEEVFSFEYEEKKYWLKKARATRSQFSHRLFYKVFSFEALLPVEEKTSEESIKFETNKIEKLQSLGVNTPRILYKNDDFFVLEDVGKMINSYIRKRDISEEKMYYFITNILKQLSKIHTNNEFHGGAQARNFTYKDEKISVIDLEDSFKKDIDLSLLQFRDLILFLLSLTKTRSNFEIDYELVINKYIELCPKNKDFKKRLKKLASKISILIFFSEIKFINNLIGRDGQGFFKLFKILKGL